VQAHCNNFLGTADRVLEARVDWEDFSVRRKDHWSSVLPFPISVEFLETVDSSAMSNVAEERSALIAERRALSSAFVSKILGKVLANIVSRAFFCQASSCWVLR
jgi:hypothetical protein